jgi:rhombotail lipoprotein
VKAIVVAVALHAAACTVEPRHFRSNALEYLYPYGAPATEPRDVSVRLPARVGIALAPRNSMRALTFTVSQQEELLRRIAEQFRGREGIAPVVIVPAGELKALGSFGDLDRIQAEFGVDLVMLVSCDQFQSAEATRASWTYWSVVGAYVVTAEKDETASVADVVMYDVSSRVMVLHAEGSDRSKNETIPADVEGSLREARARGFDRAVDGLMGKLDLALVAFQKQISSGIVHGPGTPNLGMFDRLGHPVPPGE